MAKEESEILHFSVATDIRDSLKAFATLQREMTASMKAIAKSGADMGRSAGDVADQAANKTDGWADAVGGVNKAYEEGAGDVADFAKALDELQRKAKSAHGSEKEALDAEIDALKKADQQRKKIAGPGNKPKKGGMFFGNYTPQKVRQQLKAAGEDLKEPLNAFLSKDAVGLTKGLVKVATLGFKAVKLPTNAAAGAAQAAGTAMKAAGQRKVIAGKAKGGVAGAASVGAGKGMKAMGSVVGKMGKMVSMLTKIGPALGMASSAMLGLVKVFLDADSMAKEYNKSVLQSAGNLGILAGAQGDVNVASSRLKGTLEGLREAAFDYETNLRLGITKDDHVAMTNVLTQEGVSLERLRQEAEMSGKSMKDLATQITTTGVAYSRALGVPISEIGQLQAEMATEMGRSLKETRTAYEMISQSAAESGMASNKFFSIIRGASADLGLYNNRLQDATAVLSKLGKVMNPRSAQNYMQSLTKGMKDMGRQQKIQMTIMAGSGKVQGIMQRDIERKSRELFAGITEHSGATAAELQKAFDTSGSAGLTKFLEKVPEQLRAGLTSSAIELDMQKSQASKGGVYGTAMATADLGIGAAVEVKRAALMSMNGFKSIKDALGSMSMEQVAEMLGMSDDEVKNMAKIEIAVDNERKAMLGKLDTLTGEQKASFMALLKEQGFATDDEEKLKKQIDKAGFDQIINTMSDGMKESIKGAEAQESVEERIRKLAESQGTMTQSLLDKLSVLVDFMMNKFYNVVHDIWDMLGTVFGGDAHKEKKEAMAIAEKSGNQELANIASASDFKKAFSESGLDKAIRASGAEVGRIDDAIQALAKKRDAAQSDKELQKLSKDISALQERKVQLEGIGAEIQKHFTPADMLKAIEGSGSLGSEKQESIKAALQAFKAEKAEKALSQDDRSRRDLIRAQNAAALTASHSAAGGASPLSDVPEVSLSVEDIQAVLKAQGVGADGMSSISAQLVTWGDNLVKQVGAGAAVADDLKNLGLLSGAAAPTLIDKKKEEGSGAPPITPPPASLVSERAAVQSVLGSTASEAVGTLGLESTAEAIGVSEDTVREMVAVEQSLQTESEATNTNLTDLLKGSGGIQKALRSQGIKIDRSFLKSEWAREMESAVLAAVRTALFEYYLYSAIEDRSELLGAMKDGRKSPTEMSRDYAISGMAQGNLDSALTAVRTDPNPQVASANAAGGVVTGISNGMAVVAAQGEGLASVGRGERIVPSSGGSGGVNVSVAVNGIGGRDLAKLIESKVTDGVREFKRRERYA